MGNDESIKLPTSFIQRVSAFGHLIPSAHQTNLIETMQAADKYVKAGNMNPHLNDTNANHYVARNITDTLHVDNTRGALKPMEHVAHIEPKVYFGMLKTKIDNIIAGLLKHLEDSKNDLSTKEMKANEDYAKFMIALEKENAELTKLIAGLEKENKALTAQLEKTQDTLDEFRKLLKAAEENLARLKKRKNTTKEKTREEQLNLEIALVHSRSSTTFSVLMPNLRLSLTTLLILKNPLSLRTKIDITVKSTKTKPLISKSSSKL